MPPLEQLAVCESHVNHAVPVDLAPHNLQVGKAQRGERNTERERKSVCVRERERVRVRERVSE